MDEIEERLERLAEHRAAQVPAFSMPTGDELVRRRVARRAPVIAAIAACLAVVLVIGGLLLLSGGDDPSSVQAPVGPMRMPPRGVQAGPTWTTTSTARCW